MRQKPVAPWTEMHVIARVVNKVSTRPRIKSVVAQLLRAQKLLEARETKEQLGVQESLAALQKIVDKAAPLHQLKLDVPEADKLECSVPHNLALWDAAPANQLDVEEDAADGGANGWR
jgi:hypothetical protein